MNETREISRVRRRRPRREDRDDARVRSRERDIVMQAPTVVVNQNASRETGSIARANNIAAAKAVSDVVRTTLGPRSMLKMILDASGGACDASFERSGGWGRWMREDKVRERARSDDDATTARDDGARDARDARKRDRKRRTTGNE